MTPGKVRVYTPSSRFFLPVFLVLSLSVRPLQAEGIRGSSVPLLLKAAKIVLPVLVREVCGLFGGPLWFKAQDSGGAGDGGGSAGDGSGDGGGSDAGDAGDGGAGADGSVSADDSASADPAADPGPDATSLDALSENTDVVAVNTEVQAVNTLGIADNQPALDAQEALNAVFAQQAYA